MAEHADREVVRIVRAMGVGLGGGVRGRLPQRGGDGVRGAGGARGGGGWGAEPAVASRRGGAGALGGGGGRRLMARVSETPPPRAGGLLGEGWCGTPHRRWAGDQAVCSVAAGVSSRTKRRS